MIADPETLTRRERQVMDIIHRLGEATGKEVWELLPNRPSYSAVRAVLSRLVVQGYLKYWESGPRYVYAPTARKSEIQLAAMRKLVHTVFDGSATRAMGVLLSLFADKFSKKDLAVSLKIISKAGRKSK